VRPERRLGFYDAEIVEVGGKFSCILGGKEQRSTLNWRERAKSYIPEQKPLYYNQTSELRSIFRWAHITRRRGFNFKGSTISLLPWKCILLFLSIYRRPV
jgi:hypothetical protein